MIAISPPELAAQDADAAARDARRLAHVQAERAAGRIGPLEAEFQALLHSGSADPETRHAAMRAWLAEKGPALKVERAAAEARRPPAMSAEDFAALRRRRAAHFAAERAAGRIDPLEAELQALLHADHPSPEAAHAAARAWRAEKGEALRAERAAADASRPPAMSAEALAALRGRRAAHFAAERAAGRIGPLEAELKALLYAAHPSPEVAHAAVRAWRAEKGEALKAERAARRAAAP